jgi:hypothetical protein
MTKLPVLNTLWVEGGLTYIEKVCLTSAVEAGHKVVLYTYFGVNGVPAGVEVRDGREVMPESRLMKHKKRNSWSLCANIFRYLLMQGERGIWIDADIYLLKPIEFPPDAYLFGWQKTDLINGAVLFMPKDSALVTELLDFVDRPLVAPPWLPFKKRWRYELRDRLGLKPLPLADHRWGVIGPRAITYFAHQLGLASRAVPQDVFYPLPPKRAKDAFDPAIDVARYITDRTVAVHLWNEEIKALKALPAPKGSYIEQICARHTIAMA